MGNISTYERRFNPNEQRIYRQVQDRLEYLTSNSVIFDGSCAKRETVCKLEILMEQVKSITGDNYPILEILPSYSKDDEIPCDIEIYDPNKFNNIYMEYMKECIKYLNDFSSRVIF